MLLCAHEYITSLLQFLHKVWLLLKVLVITQKPVTVPCGKDQAGKHLLIATLTANFKLHSQNLRKMGRRRRREKKKLCHWKPVSLHWHVNWRGRVHQHRKTALKLAGPLNPIHCHPMKGLLFNCSTKFGNWSYCFTRGPIQLVRRVYIMIVCIHSHISPESSPLSHTGSKTSLTCSPSDSPNTENNIPTVQSCRSFIGSPWCHSGTMVFVLHLVVSKFRDALRRCSIRGDKLICRGCRVCGFLYVATCS